MDIVLLCAGTSSRMGKTNKMLIPINGIAMAANSAMQAIKYLESTGQSSSLVVVTGYKRFSLEKALDPCKKYIFSSKSPIKMIVVYNKDYKKGQFTSVQTGVKQIEDGHSFFICLGDLPKITDNHYKVLENKLENFDAARPIYNNIPGHPVLLAPQMKDKIIRAHANNKVGLILKKCNVNNIGVQDPSWICDIDTKEDLQCLNK